MGLDARPLKRGRSVGETMFNREPHRNILTFVPNDFLARKLKLAKAGRVNQVFPRICVDMTRLGLRNFTETNFILMILIQICANVIYLCSK